MSNLHFEQATEIWTKKSRACDIPQEMSIDIETHKKILGILAVGDYYCYVFNLKALAIEYVSESINTILGYPSRTWSVQEMFDNYHPDDLPFYIKCETKIAEFFASLPLEKVLKYKARYDMRVRKSNGEYIRVLQQIVVFQSDANKNELKAFGVHTDITHLKTSTQPVLSFIGMEGEPSHYKVALDEPMTEGSLFTPREKELLPLLYNGLTSAEIAKQLYISKHTVDTHRRKMLKKTASKSVVAMMKKAVLEGWI